MADASWARWDDIELDHLSPELARRFIVGEQVMVAQIYLKAGVDVPTHSHANEQVIYILEGAMRVWLGEDESQVVDVRAGEVLCIPPNLPHRARALEDTLDLDIFTPPRQDWIDGSDTYFPRTET